MPEIDIEPGILTRSRPHGVRRGHWYTGYAGQVFREELEAELRSAYHALQMHRREKRAAEAQWATVGTGGFVTLTALDVAGQAVQQARAVVTALVAVRKAVRQRGG